MTRPVSARTRSTKARPSRASRAAAVAAQKTWAGAAPSSTARKRRSAAMAAVTPSGASRPVSPRLRPRPASTFSL